MRTVILFGVAEHVNRGWKNFSISVFPAMLLHQWLTRARRSGTADVHGVLSLHDRAARIRTAGLLSRLLPVVALRV